MVTSLLQLVGLRLALTTSGKEKQSIFFPSDAYEPKEPGASRYYRTKPCLPTPYEFAKYRLLQPLPRIEEAAESATQIVVINCAVLKLLTHRPIFLVRAMKTRITARATLPRLPNR